MSLESREHGPHRPRRAVDATVIGLLRATSAAPSRATGPKAPRWAGWRTSWPPLAPLLVLSVVYSLTLQRSTGNSFSVDTTKFDFLGQVLGTGHPPGYPLYTMLNALAVRVVPVGSVAMRANVLSAVFAVLACVIVVRVLRELGVRRALAAGGATAIGLVPAFWRSAVVAEVYSLTAVFLFAVLACVLVHERTGQRGWLRAGLLIYALSFSHATSNVLLLPGLLVFLLVRRPRWLLRPRELVTLLPGGALLALVPYAYLPWRTAVGSPYLEIEVTDLRSLWDAISGARFSGKMFAVPLEQVVDERLPGFAQEAVADFGPPLLLLCVVGLCVLLRQRTLIAVLTGAWALAVLGFVLAYEVGDWLTLLLPMWLVLAVWAVVGAGQLAALAGRQAGAATLAVAVALPVFALVSNYQDVDRSGIRTQREVDAAVAALPDGSVVFTRDYATRNQFLYRLLPNDRGERRQVWAAKGAIYAVVPDQVVYRIKQYCRDVPGPWVWPMQEQPVAPSLRRGLQPFVYGDRYAQQVEERGYRVTRVSGQLYRTSCTPTRSS